MFKEKLINFINGSWEVVETLLSGFWRILDASRMVRRIAYFSVLFLTFHAYFWTIHFIADNIGKVPGSDIALIVGAIMVPINALQGIVYKLYENGKISNK